MTSEMASEIASEMAPEMAIDEPAAEARLAEAMERHRAGRIEEAAAIYQAILSATPTHADALYLLGVATLQGGDAAGAVALFRRALEQRPAWIECYNDLGGVLEELGDLDGAEAAYREALGHAPGFAVAHYNLGNLSLRKGRLDEAIACYRAAILHHADFAEAHANLGHVLWQQGALAEAVACCRRALALRPDLAPAHNNLANALKDQGDIDGAVQGYRAALALAPDDAVTRSNLIFTLHYHPRSDAAMVAAEIDAFRRRHGQAEPRPPGITAGSPIAAIDPRRSRRGDGGDAPPLCIGFLSPHLRRHPHGLFLAPVLEAHDRGRFRMHCYADGPREDAWSDRLRQHAAVWRTTAGLSDQALAEVVRADEVDILIDLCRHTAGGRPGLFRLRPAPLQVTWMGGPCCSSGLPAMDYLIADRFHAPPGSEGLYGERLARLPGDYLCYAPPPDAPALTPLPAPERGYVTFGCFNTLAKVNPEVLEVWAELLRRVPRSRLLLQARALDDAAVRARIAAYLGARGVAPDRLDLRGGASPIEVLTAYGGVDLALDPFPYSGGVTTCEALWMGVPVITLGGGLAAVSHSRSHLFHAGLGDWITDNAARYVERAVQWAEDLPALSRLRATLRAQLAASSLCDAAGFTRGLEAALLAMWADRWDRRAAPATQMG
jgi:protein O-GlcNAc transferase